MTAWRLRFRYALVALLALVVFPAPPVPAADRSSVLTQVHMHGVVRAEGPGWVILDNATHTPSGLATVVCLSNGELQINYAQPLVTVGTAHVTTDEAYAGKVFAGPSVGLNAVFLTFRINGSVVLCSSPLLRINNSNVFVSIWGYAEEPT